MGIYSRKSNIWRETKSKDGNRKNLAKESKNTIFQTTHETQQNSKHTKLRVNKEENGMCESGCGEEETIEHVLCHCGSLEEARIRN